MGWTLWRDRIRRTAPRGSPGFSTREEELGRLLAEAQVSSSVAHKQRPQQEGHASGLRRGQGESKSTKPGGHASVRVPVVGATLGWTASEGSSFCSREEAFPLCLPQYSLPWHLALLLSLTRAPCHWVCFQFYQNKLSKKKV